MSSDDLTTMISDVIARAPDWLRRDLHADDRSARARAEDALAASVAAAINGQKGK